MDVFKHRYICATVEKMSQAKPSAPLSALTINTGLAVANPKAAAAVASAQATGQKINQPKKDYNVMRREQDQVVENYLKDLTFMIVALQTKRPKDEDFKEIREKYMLVKNEVPVQILLSSGAILWKYREKIMAADARAEAFFLEQDFEADRAKVTNELKNGDNFERFAEVLIKIKLVWHCFESAEKQAIWSRAKNMLGGYATYEANRRAMEKDEAEKKVHQDSRRKNMTP